MLKYLSTTNPNQQVSEGKISSWRGSQFIEHLRDPVGLVYQWKYRKSAAKRFHDISHLFLYPVDNVRDSVTTFSMASPFRLEVSQSLCLEMTQETDGTIQSVHDLSLGCFFSSPNFPLFSRCRERYLLFLFWVCQHESVQEYNFFLLQISKLYGWC